MHSTADRQKVAQKKEDRALRYTGCLSKIQSLTVKEYTRLKITDILDEFKVDKNLIGLLIEMGILKENKSPHGRIFHWVGSLVSEKMVDDVMDNMFKYINRNKGKGHITNRNLVPISGTLKLKEGTKTVQTLRNLVAITDSKTNADSTKVARRKTPNSETIKKYLTFLEELWYESSDGKELAESIYKMVKRHGISNVSVISLLRLNIIKSAGAGRKPKCVWVASEPTEEMADLLRVDMIKYNFTKTHTETPTETITVPTEIAAPVMLSVTPVSAPLISSDPAELSLLDMRIVQSIKDRLLEIGKKKKELVSTKSVLSAQITDCESEITKCEVEEEKYRVCLQQFAQV